MKPSFSGLSWRHLLGINLIVGVVTFAYALANIVAGKTGIALPQLAVAAFMGWACLASLRARDGNAPLLDWVRRVTAGVVIAVTVFLIVTGGGVVETSPFILTLPPVLYLLLSAPAALVLNGAFFAFLVALVLSGFSVFPSVRYELALVVSYAIVNAFLYMTTELRRRAYLAVSQLATTDPNTGLQRFDAMVEEGGRVTVPMVVLIQLADADNMRIQHGNRFVRTVVALLAGKLLARSGPTCRLYSYNDTSLLMAPALYEKRDQESWIEATVLELTKPVETGGITYAPRISVSVVNDANSLPGTDVMARIETTMRNRSPERIGATSITRYNPELDKAVHARLAMADLLRGALDRDEMRLAYQPIVDAIDGTVTGAEVLMRWHNPTLGTVSPAVFIPVAEETGIISELTEWMLATAWRARTDPGSAIQGTLSVNISPVHMEQPDFLARLSALIENESIDPRRMSLEITEGIMINNTIAASGVFVSLRAMGFSISIDDFGTGYSNVSYLTELHADRVKIDRSFVMNLFDGDGTVDSRAATIVETMVFMAKALGIGVLAEGIETREQAELLREYGCESFQGYFYGRPSELPEPAGLAAAPASRSV